MEEISTSPAAENSSWPKILLLTGIALVMILAIVVGYQLLNNRQTDVPPAISGSISETELEARHGLRVRLIGVTAGGGMIDFRLKMIDPDKARAFLQDSANMPIYLVAADGTRLLAADAMDKDLTWEEGGILFMLLPNSSGAIQPGNPVIIEFGELRLDQVMAQ